MSLYPDGHPPFIPFGHAEADHLVTDIEHNLSLVSCLNMVALECSGVSLTLEMLRAHLFRTEQLIATQPLPPPDLWHGNLPSQVSGVLKRLKATQKCLEEWLESTTCRTILDKYPARPRTAPISPPTTA